MAFTPQPPPAPAEWKGETAILELGDGFYDPVEAADFPETKLRFRNDRWAAGVGLDGLGDAEWIAHFGRFQPLPDSLTQPLALRYHGHQFRVYNPEIGDGRGFLFAQTRDGNGRLLDFGTKGSGQTPWSRFGDGRLTLKGGVREVLATEMLEALGVNTSKSFSLIETGEALERGDEPSPTRSAVLVRLSHGHIRIGSFQRLAALRDEDGMRALIAYCLRHFHGEEPGDDGAIRLLDHVVGATAELAASYMTAGFVHGVLNSDNINLTGESFDYGPWRFAPTWQPGFTAAYFDHAGLYAFGRQPEAIHWDVVQLASALRLVADVEPMVERIETFGARYQTALTDRMLWRLGVIPRGPQDDIALVQAIEAALVATDASVDRFFHDWQGGCERARHTDPAWQPLRDALAEYATARSLDHLYWSDEPCAMLIDEVEAIWDRIAADDDWSAFDAKVAAIRTMGEALRA
jgi:uncharacterized protein YdiU (UPF0061 family)